MSEQWPLWAIAFLIGVTYPVVHILWLRVMQPIRLRFADAGIALLDSDKLSERQKQIVEDYLDDAFDWKLSISLAVRFLPLMTPHLLSQIGSLSRHQTAFQDTEAFSEFEGLLSKEGGEEFIRLHLICVLGSNPVFGLIFVIQLLVLGLAIGSARKALQTVEKIVVGPTASRA